MDMVLTEVCRKLQLNCTAMVVVMGIEPTNKSSVRSGSRFGFSLVRLESVQVWFSSIRMKL